MVLSDYDISFFISNQIFFILMHLGLCILVKNHYREDNDIQFSNTDFINKLTKVLFIVTIVFTYSLGAISLDRFALGMYENRIVFTNTIFEAQGSLLSYFYMLYRTSYSLIFSICLYFSILHNHFINIVLCVISAIALFMLEMQKGTLFIIFVIVFMAYLEKSGNSKYLVEVCIIGFVIMISSSIIEKFLFGHSFIFTIIIRRILYMPVYLNYIYYDFFSNNGYIWLTKDVFLLQNIINVFYNSISGGSMGSLITQRVFSGFIPSPNNGLFSEAVAQCGIIGIFTFPFLYCCILKFIIKNSRVLGVGCLYALAFMVFTLMRSTPILVTGNILPIIIFITVLKYKKIKFKGI